MISKGLGGLGFRKVQNMNKVAMEGTRSNSGDATIEASTSGQVKGWAEEKNGPLLRNFSAESDNKQQETHLSSYQLRIPMPLLNYHMGVDGCSSSVGLDFSKPLQRSLLPEDVRSQVSTAPGKRFWADWGSLSARQRHAASIVEVFRILEETVDQLINLKLPLDVTHLQSVILVIFMSLDIYLQKMASQLVEKHHLYPAAPALTRFKETVIPTINKKAINSAVLEEIVLNKLESLTLPKLCVRVNTLQYIQNKLGTLEDSIRESWKDLATPSVNESIDTIFFKFKKLREDAGNTINTISDLIGTRAVFWDLRDSFLFTLYQGNVEGARLENCLSHFDSVLDHVCNIIVDPVRDLVVQSICRAAMDGFVWVLLEGGPSRAFLDTDFEDLQEDLQILKDFFIVDGEGLPPAIVEKEAMLTQSIIYLYSLQSESLIEMLMMASEKVSTTIDYRDNPSGSCMEDAHTLLRVLCHKKDREASEFLRRHYHLPMSSEYEETMGSSSLSSSSPFVSDLLKSEWAKKSQKSFRSMTKRFQEVTYRN